MGRREHGLVGGSAAAGESEAAVVKVVGVCERQSSSERCRGCALAEHR